MAIDAILLIVLKAADAAIAQSSMHRTSESL